MKRRRAKKSAAPGVELPTAYGRTRLMLLDVDPFHVHAAWEITPRARAAAEEKISTIADAFIWILRFHDERDGSMFDIPIELEARSWYVELWAADKIYHAEIGPCSVLGNLVPVCRSNTIVTPPAAPVPHAQPQWLDVSPALEKAKRIAVLAEEKPVAGQPASAGGIEPVLAQPPAIPATEFPQAEPPQAEVVTPVEPVAEIEPPPALAAVLEEKTAPAAGTRPMGSSELSSSFGLGGGAAKAAIELELNAEVVVYGRAQPGQTLRVNGRSVPVNDDGTFHVRWALPVAKP